MNNFWDERFKGAEYHYGTAPNSFFKEELDRLDTKGKALFPAEGEGRNAVYAAQQGWEVTAFDSSIEGKKKAMLLAQEQGVSINYLHASFDDFQAEENAFDFLVLIFAHHPQRSAIHKQLLRYLKPGGMLILEGFTKEQIHNSSGGPKNMDMLFSEEELRNDFASMSNLQVKKVIRHLDEGKHHLGEASVIQLIGVK